MTTSKLLSLALVIFRYSLFRTELEFFSDSSSENPLFINVEKQIKSCQNKIDIAQEDYIRLKQVKNSQDKSAKKVSSQELESSEEN